MEILTAVDLSDPNIKIPKLKAAGGTNFNNAIQGAIRVLKLTSDDLTPVLIFMTDGMGN